MKCQFFASSLALCLLIPLQSTVLPAGASGVPAPYGKNLMIDPGADQAKTAGHGYDDIVRLPGWKTAHGLTADSYTISGGDLTVTTPGPKNRGKNYFYGGPSNARSMATQSISLTAFDPDIAKSKVRYSLSGWLGGISGQDDNATVTVTFLDTKGRTLSSRTVSGPKDPKNTGIYAKQASGPVPNTATNAQIKLVMTRLSGSDNDGLADNLSLLLSKSTK